MPGPLDGYRILDFTRYQQGPFATVQLSDLGAEIWKVEPPDGDPGRGSDLSSDGFSRYFEAHSRGKRSIVLNLRKAPAVEAVLKMSERCDGVIENYRPGVMDRLGIGYETLSERNPRIVMVSASAFGSRGPQIGEPGYDVIGQATGGVMSLQALGDDAEPRTLPGGFADQVGAMQACIAMLAGLIAAKDTGRGQHVDVSLLGSQIALQSVYLTGFLHDGEQPHMRRRRMPTFTFYETSDGRSLVIGVVDAKNWRALCELMGHPEWERDERFATAPARQKHSADLEALLEDCFASADRDEWLRRLRGADIPSAPVNSYADVEASEQVWANGYLTEIPDPRYGTRRVTGLPWTFSETPGTVQGRAPELNADADSILAECGYSVDDIAALRAGGALPN
ncbi:MAG: CoA transferase [Chloroflexi bacterium]|nr:CoA transferase [Chloroflexota bacterium]MYF21932.1 CoA transferase [Chloroflexota bacterium]